MTVASGRISASGSSYRVDIRNPRVDLNAGTLTVDIYTGDRSGVTGFIQEAAYTMRIDGEVVAEIPDGRFSPVDGYMEREDPLSGPVDVSKDTVAVEVVVEAFNWGTELSLSFDVDIPALPPERGDISTDCSLSAQEAVVGDEVTVTAAVSNAAESPASVTVQIAAAGASETVDLTVLSGGSGSASATFTFDSPGDYTPEITVESVSEA